MEFKNEPMQQPIRKVVGQRPIARQRLVHLEDMVEFVRKHAHGALTRAEADYFPVRKVVGRARPERC